MTICDGGALTPTTPSLFNVSVAGTLNSSVHTRSLALRSWACFASWFATCVADFVPGWPNVFARLASAIARSWSVASTS